MTDEIWMTGERWNELRRRAANEHNPFKLVVILSEIAAAARLEQDALKSALQANIEKFRFHRRNAEAKRRREWEKPALTDAQLNEPRQPYEGREKSSSEAIARYLELADIALRDDEDEGGNKAA